MGNRICLLGLLFCISSCYLPERNCTDFKTGTFSFTTTIDGVEKTTSFERYEGIEVDYFEGKADTSTVRWINDCEYILKKVNPKTKSEEKSIHIKILSTKTNSYTFEYSVVGSNNKAQGTAIKTD